MVFLEEFLEKVDFEKKSADGKGSLKIYEKYHNLKNRSLFILGHSGTDEHVLLTGDHARDRAHFLVRFHLARLIYGSWEIIAFHRSLFYEWNTAS